MAELRIVLYSVPLDDEIVLTGRCDFPDGFEAEYWRTLERWYRTAYNCVPPRAFLRQMYRLVRIERVEPDDEDSVYRSSDSEASAASELGQLEAGHRRRAAQKPYRRSATCDGCLHDRPGQGDHLGPGGCLEPTDAILFEV